MEIWDDRLGHHPDRLSLFAMGGLAPVKSVLGRTEVCTYLEVPGVCVGGDIPEDNTPLLFQYWRTLHNVFSLDCLVSLVVSVGVLPHCGF